MVLIFSLQGGAEMRIRKSREIRTFGGGSPPDSGCRKSFVRWLLKERWAMFCMFLAPSELRSLAPQGTVGNFSQGFVKIREKKGSRTILHTSYLIYVQDIVFGNLRSLRYQLASYFGSRSLRLFSLSCLRT